MNNVFSARVELKKIKFRKQKMYFSVIKKGSMTTTNYKKCGHLTGWIIGIIGKKILFHVDIFVVFSPFVFGMF